MNIISIKTDYRLATASTNKIFCQYHKRVCYKQVQVIIFILKQVITGFIHIGDSNGKSKPTQNMKCHISLHFMSLLFE